MGRGPAARTGRRTDQDQGQAAGISPTDLALRTGYLKDIPLPPDAVLGFEAAGTVNAVGPGVTGTSAGDAVTALLFGLGGYAEYAVASIWALKPDAVPWTDAAALPSSAEAAVGVLRQLNVQRGETLLLFGGGGSVGIIATQLAVARGVTVISVVGEHDEALARELGATPVRYGAGMAGRCPRAGRGQRRFDAAGRECWPTRSPWPADPSGSSPCRTRPPPTSASRCPSPLPAALPARWMRRSPCSPMAVSGCARTSPCPCSRPPRPTASWKPAPSTSASSSPCLSAGGTTAAKPLVTCCPCRQEVRLVTPGAGAQPGELSPADGSGPPELLAYPSREAGGWSRR